MGFLQNQGPAGHVPRHSVNPLSSGSLPSITTHRYVGPALKVAGNLHINLKETSRRPHCSCMGVSTILRRPLTLAQPSTPTCNLPFLVRCDDLTARSKTRCILRGGQTPSPIRTGARRKLPYDAYMNQNYTFTTLLQRANRDAVPSATESGVSRWEAQLAMRSCLAREVSVANNAGEKTSAIPWQHHAPAEDSWWFCIRRGPRASANDGFTYNGNVKTCRAQPSPRSAELPGPGSADL